MVFNKKKHVIFFPENGKFSWITDDNTNKKIVYTPWNLCVHGKLIKPGSLYYLFKKSLEEEGVTANRITVVPLFAKEEQRIIPIPELKEGDERGFVDFELERLGANATYEDGHVTDNHWRGVTLPKEVIDSYEELKGQDEFELAVEPVSLHIKDFDAPIFFTSFEGMIYGDPVESLGKVIYEDSFIEGVMKSGFSSEDVENILLGRDVESQGGEEGVREDWNVAVLGLFAQVPERFRSFAEDKKMITSDLPLGDSKELYLQGREPDVLAPWDWLNLDSSKGEKKERKPLGLFKSMAILLVVLALAITAHYFVILAPMKGEGEDSGMVLPVTLDGEINVKVVDGHLRISGTTTDEDTIKEMMKKEYPGYGPLEAKTLVKAGDTYHFVLESR